MNAALAVPVLLLSVYAVSQPTEQPSLVAERNPSYSFKDGILELGDARGWLRTSDLYLNFRAAFDFKAITTESDAGVLLRTWTGTNEWPERGYRFKIPTESSTKPGSVLVGHRTTAIVVQEGRIDLKPSGEWQEVEIVGDGRRITVSLNRTLVGVFEVERYGGHILFDNRKGRVQLRNIRIASTEADSRIPGNLMTLKQLNEARGQPPRLVHQVRPTYTEAAMRRLVQGRVLMDVVVLPDGSTGLVRVTRSLDPDLDLSAVAAVRAWKFSPAVLSGQEVAVLVEIEMTFRF